MAWFSMQVMNRLKRAGASTQPCRNPVYPRGFSQAGLFDRLRNFIHRWEQVEAGDHGLLWDLVEHKGVHSGGSVEQGTEVFPPPCGDSALLLKQG